MYHERFADLPDIEDVKRFSPDRDRECFSELANVLHQHGKSDRLLVTLLHTHFEVADDEVIVEHIDTQKRQVIESVLPEENLHSDMPCVNWRLTERGLLALEFTASPDQYNRAELTASDHICLHNIRPVLIKHGALNRFGVALSSREICDRAREILVERPFVESRTLKSEVVSREAVQHEHSIETVWEVRSDMQLAARGCRACVFVLCRRK